MEPKKYDETGKILPKPEKYFPKSEKKNMQQEVETGKGIPESGKLLFQQETNIC